MTENNDRLRRLEKETGHGFRQRVRDILSINFGNAMSVDKRSPSLKVAENQKLYDDKNASMKNDLKHDVNKYANKKKSKLRSILGLE